MSAKRPSAAKGNETRRDVHERDTQAAPSPTDRYVEELSRTLGAYAKPAAEARRIIDEQTGSLTDALYGIRREDGRVK